MNRMCVCGVLRVDIIEMKISWEQERDYLRCGYKSLRTAKVHYRLRWSSTCSCSQDNPYNRLALLPLPILRGVPR